MTLLWIATLTLAGALLILTARGTKTQDVPGRAEAER